MYERIWTGIHVVRTIASIFPYVSLERKSEADRSVEVVRTDVSWNISFFIQWRVRTETHVVRTNDARSVGRPDGMARRPDGWQGTDFSDLQNLLKHFWKAESLFKQNLYIQVILSKQNDANHKLTEEILNIIPERDMIHCHPKTQLLTTFTHVSTFLFLFLGKNLKAARGPPCQVGKVVKSCVLRWQKIIYLPKINIGMELYIIFTFFPTMKNFPYKDYVHDNLINWA